MARFKNLLRRSNVQVLDADGFPIEDNTDSSRNITLNRAMRTSLAVSAQRFLGSAFAEPELQILDEADKPMVIDPSTARTLLRPNQFQKSKTNFMGAIGRDLGVLGECFLHKVETSEGLVLNRLPPLLVVPEPTDDKRGFKHYTYNDKDYSVEEIIHLKGIEDYENPLRGMCPLAALLSTISLDENATFYSNTSLERLGLLGIFIAPDYELTGKNQLFKYVGEAEMSTETQASVKRFNDSINRLVRGLAVYWPGKAVINRIAPSPKDMQALEVYRKTESRMAAVLGVSASLMNLEVGLDQSTYNNLVVMRKFVTENTLVHLWKSVQEHLTNELLFERNLPGRFQFNWKTLPSLSEDLNTLTNRVAVMIDKRIISPEAGAEMIGVAYTGDDVEDTQDVEKVDTEDKDE